MNRKETALDCLNKKYNCAQAVLFSFADDVGLDKDTAIKISACFGGGMRCGEVCGAVTGMLMAIGMKYSSSEENDEASKKLAYEKGTEFINEFKKKEGTILCRELLKLDGSKSEEVQKELHKNICFNAIITAVEIAEKMI